MLRHFFLVPPVFKSPVSTDQIKVDKLLDYGERFGDKKECRGVMQERQLKTLK